MWVVILFAACRFASKEDWLVPHKAGRAFKELKAWQASSGIQVCCWPIKLDSFIVRGVLPAKCQLSHTCKCRKDRAGLRDLKAWKASTGI